MNYADLFNTIFAKDHLVQELGYFLLMSHQWPSSWVRLA